MVGFTHEGAQRVANATLYVETLTKNGPSKGNRASKSSPLGFWAKITGGNAGKYSWTAIKHKTDLSNTEDEDWGKAIYSDDFGYAVEAFNASEWVIKNDIVWLTPAKSDDGSDYYVFQYNPGMIWCKGSGTIPAATGTDTITPGDGFSFAVWRMDYATATMTATTSHVDVYNPFKTAITPGSSKFIQCAFRDGVWFLTGVEC